ncbi:MAG: putative pyruvate carboxylase subunit, partial [Methermicoccus sp.]|nr:putative pyruvate carboxylase subunit [Methermicoccus sp.]
DEIIDGFFKNAVASGLDIMRIFDALNEVDNIKASVKYIKKYGGMADCAVCYTVDPKYDEVDEPQTEKKKTGFLSGLFGKKEEPKKKPAHEPVFTDQYFLNKAKEMLALGADMITIKDMSGLIPPSRVATLMPLFKKNLNVPIDFHTHCTPGFGLGAVLSAIINGVDIVDAVIWNFAGGPAAPAIELIYIFCKKLGVELDVNMEAVAKINKELLSIRHELEAFDAVKQIPKPFNPLTDTLPAEIDREFDKAIEAAKRNDEEALLDACHKIEAYFNFPAPDELVKNAEIPGGMYTNMVAQLKQFNSMDILEDAMKLIPSVRLDAGLPPLVTPTSQIVGAQAVASALNIKNGRPKYANPSNQFIALVKGEYGKTPVPIDPKFREQITGSPVETPYDTSNYKKQDNPVLPEYGGVHLAKNEKDQLLLELFPTVAAKFLRELREKEFKENSASKQTETVNESTTQAEKTTEPAKKGRKMESPMPGIILKVEVKKGDMVKRGDRVLVLEAMKMENDILAEYTGEVVNVFVNSGDSVQAGAPLIEIA